MEYILQKKKTLRRNGSTTDSVNGFFISEKTANLLYSQKYEFMLNIWVFTSHPARGF